MQDIFNEIRKLEEEITSQRDAVDDENCVLYLGHQELRLIRCFEITIGVRKESEYGHSNSFFGFDVVPVDLENYIRLA